MLSREQCIAKYSADVKAACAGTGLLPSVRMAQLIEESGDGNHAPENAFFGIKADASWHGKKQLLATFEYIGGVRKPIQDWFRAYDTPLESIKDSIQFLKAMPRYHDPKHNVFAAKNYKEQAQALQDAGYSTSPKYAHDIIWIIEHSGLAELDK